ncbi:MAG TPA: hypothetical protein P5561_03590 [Candidatus Omnitrophota bacterium]|nr:hypothetical protein [Candidatus Omnitrophota bacterium]HRY85596.1 hypothetical protein [Candidatus Omnitrophota bacterium]
MKVLKGILKEEEQRLKEAQGSYEREIGKLPKGSVQIKKIKERDYAYRAYRKGERVVYEYVGDLKPEELKDLGKKIELRQRYEEKLREVKANLKEVKRMIRD